MDDNSVKTLVYETPTGTYKIPVGTEASDENIKRASEMVEHLCQLEVEKIKSINHLEEERIKTNVHLEEVRIKAEAETRIKEMQNVGEIQGVLTDGDAIEIMEELRKNTLTHNNFLLN